MVVDPVFRAHPLTFRPRPGRRFTRSSRFGGRGGLFVRSGEEPPRTKTRGCRRRRRMGCGSRTATMEVCGGVPARRLPSAAAGHTPSGPSGHLPQQAGEGVALAVGRQVRSPFPAKSGKVARSAGWGVESRTATMEVCGGVHARRLPSAAAGHTPSGASRHLPQQAGEWVALAVGRQDGRAALFPTVHAQVRSGAASEHDESGDHALARGSQSSDRRTRLSQANADRTLFRGLRLSCAKARRRSRWPHARDGDSQDQGHRERRLVSTRRISHLAISGRSHHRRVADRC